MAQEFWKIRLEASVLSAWALDSGSAKKGKYIDLKLRGNKDSEKKFCLLWVPFFFLPVFPTDFDSCVNDNHSQKNIHFLLWV